MQLSDYTSPRTTQKSETSIELRKAPLQISAIHDLDNCNFELLKLLTMCVYPLGADAILFRELQMARTLRANARRKANDSTIDPHSLLMA